MTATSKLAGRDYVLLLDKSGSMGTKDQANNASRWDKAREMTLAMARKCAEFDPDGITVIPFNDSWKEYKNIKDGEDQVNRIFTENQPNLGTETAGVLKHVLDDYFKNPQKPVTILVVTDGQPNSPDAVKKVIAEATQKMTADEQIGITFIQVGNDKGARAFLKELDDDLVSTYKAKFDIVDTRNDEEMQNMTIEDILLAAVND